MKIQILNLGQMDYTEALKLQNETLLKRQKDEVGDTLILVEHPDVLTLGRRGKMENILLKKEELIKKGVEVHEISRGGDVTYHGPGQVVCYPIMDLNALKIGVRDFVWGIEESVILFLKEKYSITAHREEKEFTGVWVGNEKIMAVGISVKRGVTMHGFAFNAFTDLSRFDWIIPCGLPDRGVTSLQKLTGILPDWEETALTIAGYFCRTFDLEE